MKTITELKRHGANRILVTIPGEGVEATISAQLQAYISYHALTPLALWPVRCGYFTQVSSGAGAFAPVGNSSRSSADQGRENLQPLAAISQGANCLLVTIPGGGKQPFQLRYKRTYRATHKFRLLCRPFAVVTSLRFQAESGAFALVGNRTATNVSHGVALTYPFKQKKLC